MKRPAFIILASLLLFPALVCADPISDLLTGSQASAPADKVSIAARSDSESDRLIRTRIQDIFSELDELGAIIVKVRHGVVTLDGTLSSQTAESRALELALQVEGVVDVKNQLEVRISLSRRLGRTLAQIRAVVIDTLAMAPLFGIALLTVALFWWLGIWSGRRRTWLGKLTPNAFVIDLIAQVIRLSLLIVGIVLALHLLDASSLIGTVLGAAGIFGLAVGFAVRDTVENYIASIMLSIRRPFALNELVDIDGASGHVARLTSRATVLLSPDGNHIRIPNSVVFKSTITNYTRNPKRRFEFKVGIDTAQDLLAAQALVLESLVRVPGMLETPAPLTLIEELGDSNVVIRIFGWVDQSTHDLGKVRSEAIRAVKTAFDDAGVGMPEPTYNLCISEATTTPVGKRTNAQHSEAWSSRASDTQADHGIESETDTTNHSGRSENLLADHAASEL